MDVKTTLIGGDRDYPGSLGHKDLDFAQRLGSWCAFVTLRGYPMRDSHQDHDDASNDKDAHYDHQDFQGLEDWFINSVQLIAALV